jgi:protein TonB
MHMLEAHGADEADHIAVFQDRVTDRMRMPRIGLTMPNSGTGAPSHATGYTGDRRINWRSVGVVAALHLLLGAVLVQQQVIPPHRVQSAIRLLDLNTPPPAPEAPPPPELAEPEIYVPPPAIDLPRPAPTVTVTVAEPQPAPVPPAVVKSIAVAPRPTAPPSVMASDLGATMISARPPVYPMESRRKHEQGTVVLMLMLDTEGRVADIRVERSSGHDRLDRAALSAVRQWRWSPTVRDGVPVAVRGLVEIPFVLKG